LLGGQLVSHGGWRWIFVLLLAFGLVVMAAVARLLPESLPPERRISGAVPDVARLYAKLLGDVRFLGTAIPISFASAMLFSYIAGSSFVFIELNHLSPVEYSVYFSANAVGLFSVAQTNRWLLKRWHSRQILFAAFATNCGFALIFLLSTLAHWGGFPVLYVCLFGCMATLGLIFPNAAALTMMPFGREAGSVSSLMGTLQYGLGAGVGAIQGLWHDGTALPMAVMVLASSALGFGFLWVFQVSPTQVVAELESS
jgi:DHA1 family bicyclomycin/chloramphenicol resistance-like MFS transporter